MRLTRRRLLAAALAGGGLATLPAAAQSLTEAEARAHVRSAVDAVLAIVTGGGGAPEKAAKLRKVLDRYAAMAQIAQFAAGVAWRSMSGDQQRRFTDAFEHFLSTVYARRFQDYSGQTVTIGQVSDAGKRGVIVASTVSQPNGQPIAVDWLVSDRPGRVVIADIVIEGISLLVSQREEIGGMLESRGGNVERLIADLRAA